MKNILRNITAILCFLLPYCAASQDKLDNYTIGINQFVSQSVLDAVYKGINDRFKESAKFKIYYQNVMGDESLNVDFTNQLVKKDVDLIIALATPSAQAAKNAKADIPVVFSAVTDPVSAGLVNSLEAPGGNVTGYTDMLPYDKQVLLIKQYKPDVRCVGIIVNYSESNCQAGMVRIKETLHSEGLKYVEKNATNGVEVIDALGSLLTQCDLILISPSNIVYESTPGIIERCKEKGVMVIGGTEEHVAMGSVATYSFDFYDMGVKTAELAIRILEDKLNPAEIPVATAQTKLVVNEEAIDYYKNFSPKNNHDYLVIGGILLLALIIFLVVRKSKK